MIHSVVGYKLQQERAKTRNAQKKKINQFNDVLKDMSMF